MNVTLPETKLYLKYKIIYSVIICICILSIILVIYGQFIEGKTVTTIGKLKGKSEEGYEILKTDFDKLFKNELKNYDDKYKGKKDKLNQDLVYTSYKKVENEDNSYDINVRIPHINVKGEQIEKYNKEIENTFKNKAENIMETKNKNSIYTVDYTAYIQDGILSVAIKANLKEGNSAQRIIVKTYNYSLDEDKEVNLEDVLKLENVQKEFVQSKIEQEVKNENKKAEDLKALGYDIFERDLNSDKYKVENIEEFYIDDGSIYIIFAYGNEKRTSEMDLVVI